MRLHRVVLACVTLLLAAPVAHSAEIGPGGDASCLLKLEGTIEAGDGDKLSAALDALGSTGGFDSREVSLCLNSVGGDYAEALKMIAVVLKHSNIATIVDRGAECYSACAFVFLAGNSQASEDGELVPDRTLDVGATLGFHAPYLPTPGATSDVAVTAETFRGGVLAIARLLEIDARELFPRGLLGKALQVGPNDFLYIDTIEKVGVWKIKLKGYKPPAALSARMLDQACRSKDLWTNFSHSILGRQGDDADVLHGMRQSDFPELRGSDEPITLAQGKYRAGLDMFGYEATNKCIADVFAGPDGALYISLSMLPAEQPDPDQEQLAGQVMAALNDRLTLEVLTTPLWYGYAPDTPLLRLPRR